MTFSNETIYNMWQYVHKSFKFPDDICDNMLHMIVRSFLENLL